MATPRKTLSIIIGILILVSLVAVLYPFITNPTSITSAYESAGVAAPLLFIVLVMIAPTPGAVVGASGGGYFGIWEGAIYLLIGNLLGVCITFLLVQRFGRPAAERFVQPAKLRQYERFVHDHPFLQWVVYAIPIFPIELMTFIIALSGKRFGHFFLTVITALPLYALLVTTIGYNVSSHYKTAFDYASIAVLCILVYAILHFLYIWKQEEILQTGRRIGMASRKLQRDVESHVQRSVNDISTATSKAADSVKKSLRPKR